jgi:hypothetical protein
MKSLAVNWCETYRNTPIGSMSTSHFDGCLIGFGTTIAEEDLLGTRVGAQPVGKSSLFRDEIQIGHMMNFLHLILNGICQVFVVVTQGTSGNSTDAIQVVLSICCFQKAPLAGIDRQFVAAASKKRRTTWQETTKIQYDNIRVTISQ